MDQKPMAKLIDALSARTRFGELMKRAEEDNTRFLVSRRGKPTVVILSVSDFLSNIIQKPSIMAEIQSDAVKAGLNQMTDKEIDAEIEACRKSEK